MSCARWVEAALVGLGCALGLCAIAIYEGTSGPPRTAAVVVGFVAAALTWGRAQRPLPAQMAARIDEALGMNGAFMTAWQVEGRVSAAGSNSMLELLIRQTLHGLRWRDVRRAVLPPSLVCVALPLTGAALLAGALQGAHSERRLAGWERSLAQELVQDLARARDAAFASVKIDDQTQQCMAELVADARGLSAGASAGPESLPDRELLERLAQDLAAVAPMTQADARVDDALERAASALAALQAAATSSANWESEDPSREGGGGQNADDRADSVADSSADRGPGDQAARALVQAGAGTDRVGGSGIPGEVEQPLQAEVGGGVQDSGPNRAASGLDYLEFLPAHRRALARRWIQLQSSGR